MREYHIIRSPSDAFDDLMSNSGFRNASEYIRQTVLVPGEIGYHRGKRIVRIDDPICETDTSVLVFLLNLFEIEGKLDDLELMDYLQANEENIIKDRFIEEL